MNNKNTIALSIFVGFALVAASIYAVGVPPVVYEMLGIEAGVESGSVSTDTPRRESDYRNVYGDPDASVTIVEFSDYECPFCARLHPTLKRIVDESKSSVNWEFRHLPLPSHRNAELAAQISECVRRELGNDAFWSYTDTVFANQHSVNIDYLTTIAAELGVEEKTLTECLADPEIDKQVGTDLATARAFGGSGTPFSVIIFADGTTRPVSGALPYQNWAALLNL